MLKPSSIKVMQECSFPAPGARQMKRLIRRSLLRLILLHFSLSTSANISGATLPPLMIATAVRYGGSS